MNEQDTKKTGLADNLKSVAGLSIGIGVLMIVVGLLAIFNPFAAGLGISLVLGWLIVFGGITHLIYAFSAGGVGGFLWRTLIGIAYIIGGFYLVFNPQIALASLTLVVGIVLIAESVLQFAAFYELRSVSGSGWILIDGIMSLVLGILILYPFPATTEWVVGTIFGINMLSSGITRVMYSAAAKRVISSTATQH
jgi:uncharacterized membrane protein HdeD (DUF308 family)